MQSVLKKKKESTIAIDFDAQKFCTGFSWISGVLILVGCSS